VKIDIFTQLRKYYFEIILIAILLFMYQQSFSVWFSAWTSVDSFYSFALFIFGFLGYLYKTHYDKLKEIPKEPSFFGSPFLLAGFICYTAGIRAGIEYLTNLSLPLFIGGIILALYGKKVFKITLIPLILFACTLPILPLFRITMPLQFLSTKLTVMFLNTLGVSAYNEGTIVCIEHYKLSVVAGCSGFKSLTTLFFMCIMYSYFIKTTLFKKVLFSFISLPLAIIMNTLRISAVGIYTVYGYKDVQSFHDNLGIVAFVISLGIIIGLMKTLEDKEDENQNE